MNKCRMSPFALGMALGLVWGLSLLIMGLVACYVDYGRPFVTSINTLYWGYEPTILGSFIGAGIGFVDAFIGGAIIAALYNCFCGCCGCCSSGKECKK